MFLVLWQLNYAAGIVMILNFVKAVVANVLCFKDIKYRMPLFYRI